MLPAFVYSNKKILFGFGMALGAGGWRCFGIVGLVVRLVAVAAILVKGLGDIFPFLFV